jgi:hypothetical protein
MVTWDHNHRSGSPQIAEKTPRREILTVARAEAEIPTQYYRLRFKIRHQILDTLEKRRFCNASEMQI